MGTRVYIGNLPPSATETMLRELVGQGAREVLGVILPRGPGGDRLRGFALVEMASRVDAVAAVDALEGHLVAEHRLMVNIARVRLPELDPWRTEQLDEIEEPGTR